MIRKSPRRNIRLLSIFAAAALLGCADRFADRYGNAMKLLASSKQRLPVNKFNPNDPGLIWEARYKACFGGEFPAGFTMTEHPVVMGKKEILYKSEPPGGFNLPCLFSVEYSGKGVYSIRAKRGAAKDGWLVDLANGTVQ